MKKEMLIVVTLVLGFSLKSYAGTGNAADGLAFFLVVIGVLLFILGLITGVDFLQKNGKTMIHKATSFLSQKITHLRDYLNKLKSEYFDISYF